MSGRPRNRRAFEAAQEHRRQIRAVMLDHALRHPLSRPLTGEQVQALFPRLALSTVFWHMSEIRREADDEDADILESL
jgi:hypothetical protein